MPLFHQVQTSSHLAELGLDQGMLIPLTKVADLQQTHLNAPTVPSKAYLKLLQMVNLASDMQEQSFASPLPSMQRFPSMDNIAHNLGVTGSAQQIGDGPGVSHVRAASWGGSYSDVFKTKMAEEKFSRGVGMQLSFMPSDPSAIQLSNSSIQPNNGGGGGGGGSGDDLHEVEL
ncbi:hypothetical protein J5N97_018475 [Dioscorea zingiberensis]|uniref:Uncharacterized protein n=1 Tax=Dioscorea zingiberensis TaxID=325984 RepID=A0A9D5HBH4_9LILI|nr:hypothetical protein J5N97_018475 [Dioscorea zingiberensis]